MAGSEIRRLSARPVTVRFTPATASRIRRIAAAERVSDAALIRSVMVAALAAVPEEAPLSRRRGEIAPAVVLEITRLREHVAELCGALVQAAIHEREGGGRDSHREIEAVIPDVRRAVKRLDALKLRLM